MMSQKSKFSIFKILAVLPWVPGSFFNLTPRFSLLPVERPWLGLVTRLPESGRLHVKTKDLGYGADKSVRFASTEHSQVSGKCSHNTSYLTLPRRLCFFRSQTSQEKTLNTENKAENPLTVKE